MTPNEQRGGHRAVAPFRPTQTGKDHVPTTCYCCGRRADGMGFGSFRSDPLYLCELCRPIMEHIKAVTNFDIYELAAVDRAGQRAGAFLDKIGKTDLATLDPGEWGFFLREIIEGFGAELRKEIASGVPF